MILMTVKEVEVEAEELLKLSSNPMKVNTKMTILNMSNSLTVSYLMKRDSNSASKDLK
jgi:hypothetical protein